MSRPPRKKLTTLSALAILSLAIAGPLLALVNPGDPEGANLLVTLVVAAGVFVCLWAIYSVLSNM